MQNDNREMKLKKGLVLLLLVPSLSYAAEPRTAKAMVEVFFVSLQKADVSGAYDNLFRGSSIPKDKPQAIAVLKQQTQGALPFYGKVLGSELVHEEAFGTSLVRLVYLLKAERHATVWEFYFYKPKNDWFLANILFNDQFNLLNSKK